MEEILAKNASWMLYNISLAVIPVFLGWWMLYVRNNLLKVILFAVWLSFVPNTIYIFTDIIHILKDAARVDSLFELFVISFQYVGLLTAGFITYILALYPADRLIRTVMQGKNKKHKKYEKSTLNVIIILNFLIGIGIVLGRVYRLNSWDILMEIEKVFVSALNLVTTPSMIALSLFFGIVANFVYFGFKKKIVNMIFREK